MLEANATEISELRRELALVRKSKDQVSALTVRPSIHSSVTLDSQ